MDIMDGMDTMDFPFDGRMDRFKDVTCCTYYYHSTSCFFRKIFLKSNLQVFGVQVLSRYHHFLSFFSDRSVRSVGSDGETNRSDHKFACNLIRQSSNPTNLPWQAGICGTYRTTEYPEPQVCWSAAASSSNPDRFKPQGTTHNAWCDFAPQKRILN